MDNKETITLEIEFGDGHVEQCELIKKFTNGDFKISRKGLYRIELFRQCDMHYINNKYQGQEISKFIWLDAYIKDSKKYEIIRLRRIEQF